MISRFVVWAALAFVILITSATPLVAQPVEERPAEPDVSALVHAATSAARGAAWKANDGYRRGQRSALATLPPETVKNTLAALSVEHALLDARQALEQKQSRHVDQSTPFQ